MMCCRGESWASMAPGDSLAFLEPHLHDTVWFCHLLAPDLFPPRFFIALSLQLATPFPPPPPPPPPHFVLRLVGRLQTPQDPLAQHILLSK